MHRPKLHLLLLVCVLACGLWHTACGLGSGPADLNVVLISYDTLRADHLSLYGYETRETSPILDALSRRGVVFERAVSQASSTFPSHMSLFQSRFASQISGTSPMLAEILQRSDFATAAFTNGGNVSQGLGFGRGFDVYFETRSQAGLAEIWPEAERWLRQNHGRPFFLFLHTYDIHHPYDPPAEFQEMFTGGYEGTITGKSTGPLLNKVRKIHNFSDFEGEVQLSAADREHIRALYDADIRNADGYLAKIDSLFRELGLWNDTLVVFLSDHGEEFWEHGEVLHSFTVYQEVVHVPLVIWLPAASDEAHEAHEAAGKRIPQQVRLMDVAPTILDVLRIEPPVEMQGESFMPFLEASAVRQPGRPAVAEMNSLKAWIEPPHKLIVDQEARKLSYFHLNTDPLEQAPESDGRLPRGLYRRLAETLGTSIARPVSGPAQMELPEDQELLDQLRALGYID